jgi:hypothetical protein
MSSIPAEESGHFCLFVLFHSLTSQNTCLRPNMYVEKKFFSAEQKFLKLKFATLIATG